MHLDLVQDRVWAILPSKMEEIDALILKLLASVDHRLVAAQFEAENEDIEPRLSQHAPANIAVVNVYDTIMQRASLMTRFSGGTSTERIRSELVAALNNPDVDGIILNVNSPGGTVHGVGDLSDFIFEAKKKKRIGCYCDGLMCSAAYWIGSACDFIVATSTSQIGSIGVVATHYDTSKKDESEGVKRSYVCAGKYKRITADNAPLTQDGKNYLQESVDQYMTLFVDAVARNRGVTEEEALAMSGDARVYIAGHANGRGLIDRVGNFETALELLKGSPMNEEMKLLQQELEEAKAKIESMVTDGAELESLRASLSEAKTNELELARALRKSQIQSRVDRLVSTGHVTPAMVEGGLVQVLLAIDSVPGIQIVDGDELIAEMKPMDWIFDHLLNTDSPVLKLNNEQFAVDGVSKTKDVDSEVAMGLAIAKSING